MVALAKDRNTPVRLGNIESHPIKSATTIFAGSMVFVDATGFAVPGATALGLTAVGRAEQHIENDGANGDKRVETRRGVFRFENSGGVDELTRGDIGDTAYAVDDQTVAKTSATNTRSAAGIVRDVDDHGVWIEI